jgi:hypothetical protein
MKWADINPKLAEFLSGNLSCQLLFSTDVILSELIILKNLLNSKKFRIMETGWHLAQVNIGKMIGSDINDPIMKEFVEQLDEVNALAEQC